jgi:adenylate cyclase class 2
MQTEIEAKFLDINHDALRAKLRELGATCEQPMRLMRRKHLDFPDGSLRQRHGWARVRDEGGKVTMSYKQMADRSLHGTSEVCLTVDNFAQAEAFLLALGLQVTAYQETKRESWRLGELEIELDHWPWTRPYMEVEGPDEATLKTFAKQLGLDWSKAVHGSAEIVYTNEYDVTDAEFNTWDVITFTPVPAWLESKRKKHA